MNETLAYTAAALAAAAATWPLARRRLELSLAKHPSLAGHSRLAKRVAALVPVSYTHLTLPTSDLV